VLVGASLGLLGLCGCVAGWVVGWLGGGLLVRWVAGWLGGWVAGQVGGWVAGWVTGWLGGRVCVVGWEACFFLLGLCWLACLFLFVCSTSFPRGNQVDGLPRAQHLVLIVVILCQASLLWDLCSA
jgi:hypothetical protein